MENIICGIDNENLIRAELEVIGTFKTVPYGAVVDTGFTGGLVLPIFIAVDIGLEKVGGSTITLADGSIKTVPTFLAKIKLGHRVIDVTTLVMGNEILIGTEALTKHRICISTGTGNVVIEDAASLENYNELSKSLQKLTGD